MMTEQDISERNGYLISLIAELNLGIHIVDLPHKPKFLTSDSKYSLKGYVHNFNLILNGANDEVFYETKLRPLNRMNIEEISSKFIDWMTMFEHTRIYTISLDETGLFVTGFNHHNKILKKNPYPVFARYSPVIYYEIDRAESVLERFDDYNLSINN
jgi:hypothetical protein